MDVGHSFPAAGAVGRPGAGADASVGFDDCSGGAAVVARAQCAADRDRRREVGRDCGGRADHSRGIHGGLPQYGGRREPERVPLGSLCGRRSVGDYRVCERTQAAAGCIFAIFLLAAAAQAQFLTKLDASTIEEFERYTKSVEGQPFPAIDKHRLLQGELVVEAANPQNPVAISGGLIHDWVGAVYISNTSMRTVLDVLQNFDRHAQIYPSVKQSRTLARKGDEVDGYWRLERPDPLLTVVLDVKQRAYYREIAPGKWTCRAYADDIREVEHAGTARERVLPAGEGHGFLWRFNAYWSMETLGKGVVAECRTVSLSRDVPKALAWAINPFVQKLPRESLVSTLEHTREAAAK